MYDMNVKVNEVIFNIIIIEGEIFVFLNYFSL